MVTQRETTTPDGREDLPKFIRKHREELVLKPNRSYGGTGVHLGAAVSQAEWERLLDEALAKENDPYESWVVQSAATLPVHLFPVLTDGRSHDEPFYAVMGFAPTDHGLGHDLPRVAEAGRERRAARRSRAGARGPSARGLAQLRANARARGAGARGARRDDQEAPRPRRRDSACSSGTRRRIGPARAADGRAAQLARRRRPAARAARERPARRLGRRGHARARRAARGSPPSSAASRSCGARRSRCPRRSSRRSPRRARTASRRGSARATRTTSRRSRNPSHCC